MFPNRWLAYFDILGFSQLIKSTHPDIILELYNEALDLFENEKKDTGLSSLHFSDTFIFYSSDDTPESYTWIQLVASKFMHSCLKKHIPMRGAITVGEFYVDSEKGIYMGKALIEAYHEAESQDWIGLILTKSAEEKVVGKYALNPAFHNFPMVAVPKKNQLHAYSFKGNTTYLVNILQQMQDKAPDKDKVKYQNTIDHLMKQSSM